MSNIVTDSTRLTWFELSYLNISNVNDRLLMTSRIIMPLCFLAIVVTNTVYSWIEGIKFRIKYYTKTISLILSVWFS
jgi:hypothetical protein